MKKGTLTRRMENAFDGLQKEFCSLWTIEDFKDVLKALKISKNKSDYPSKLRDLYKMLDAYSIEYEENKGHQYYERLVRENSSKIPTAFQAEDTMLRLLYNEYSKYATPKEYICRIVDRLSSSADGWHSDTLKVRILKQFIKYGNCLTYNAERNGVSRKVNVYGGDVYIKKYMQQKDANIRNVVDGLDLLKDDIFDVLSEATKEQKKPDGKYGIIKMVDDLATGKFRTGGATKKSLYLFAMVYGMTFRSSGAEIIDYDTDIEINLFRDYYNNNLMRFVTEAYNDNLCELDLEPSDQGINYKNFAEIVYLYYISKDCSPDEKIKASNEMIYRIQMASHKKGFQDEKRVDKQTVYYMGLMKQTENDIYCEDVFLKDETCFEEFVRENYECDTYAGSHSVGVMQLGTAQNTAFKVYEDILKELKEGGFNLESCGVGAWFIDVNTLEEKASRVFESEMRENKQKVYEFIKLLKAIEKFLGNMVIGKPRSTEVEGKSSYSAESEGKLLQEKSAKDVTRTAIIVAYYYYYNAINEDVARNEWSGFKAHFYDFKQGVDEKLEASFYQPLSTRNIFDVFVVISSYAFLNM